MKLGARIVFTLIGLALLPTPVLSQSAGQGGTNLGKSLPPPVPAHDDEHIVMPKFPKGWIEQQPDITEAIEVVEYLPPDQTPATWREKITLEIHHNSNTLPIDAFQRRALALFRQNCEGVIEGKLQTGLNNGFPSAFWTLGCKRDKRGNFGEVRYTKAVQGHDTMYLLSRSWRTPAFSDVPPVSQQQVEEAVGFLTTSVVCANAAQHPCPAAAPK